MRVLPALLRAHRCIPCPLPHLTHRLRCLTVRSATLQDPQAGKVEGCCHPAQRCCKRKLSAFAPEVRSDAPSGAHSLAGRGAGTPPALRTRQLAPSPQGSGMGEQPTAPSPVYRLVLAGDSGAGKSSFLLRLCRNEFRGDISSTLGTRAGMEGLGYVGWGLMAAPDRGGLSGEGAAGGWGANHPADLGHCRAGKVRGAAAPTPCHAARSLLQAWPCMAPHGQ